jgi:hypothetical protein
MIKDRQTDHETTEENANTHSVTFGCPNAQANASQPKEPEFFTNPRQQSLNLQNKEN